MKQMGVKFRRQAVIGRYIVNFVCYEKKLIIEVDGGQHVESKADKIRDEWLKEEGFEMLRFWNNDVMKNLEGVIEKIVHFIQPPSLTLPTRGREFSLFQHLVNTQDMWIHSKNF